MAKGDKEGPPELPEDVRAVLRFNELVSGILAHDLKNPLAAVLMNARLLRAAEGARERKLGARIVASGERMSRMIDQIADWTRLRSEDGHVCLARAECDLGEVAQNVVTELRTLLAAAPVSLEARGPLVGRWDADRLAQMLSNLVGNGLEHATSPGVSVLLDGRGEDVVLRVENEGALGDEQLPVLFEPFAGRASGAKARGRGLGLGLYLTRQIVVAHGGRIEVERPSGPRVAFQVTLPRGADLPGP